MKIPLSWLKKYIDTDLSPQQIADTLTMIGIEVDAIELCKPEFQGVVVVEVLQASPHPDAEKLTVAEVSDGTATYQIVCGASNCRKGLRTALATVGSTLKEPDGKSFKVKKSKLRGVESFGMLCAGDELGLEGNSDGIIEFEPHLPLGTDVAEMYGETVIEVSLTPNLAHCASIYGVARELGAAINGRAHFPEFSLKEDPTLKIDACCHVKVEDTIACPRYACRFIKGIEVGPSPEWLKTRVEACGFRSVNNVVDVTNFVLMELGHPLHAFDADKLEGGKIQVRHASLGEEITTLDAKTRKLQTHHLLICDQKGAVAVAGIMGGLHSEVTPGTVNILLESAYFSPTSVRRTSKQLGIQTDSSKRFERGADPNCVIRGLDRAASLIVSVAGGVVAKGVIDLKDTDFPEKVVNCRLQRVNDVLGTLLSGSEVEDIWKRLGFSYKWQGDETFVVTIPTYRVDISSEIDLIEEVVRFYGYANVSRKAPRYVSSKLENPPIYTFENEIRSRLVAMGLQEFLTCDLVGPSQLDVAGETFANHRDQVKVLNPTSIEQSILRTSLFPGLLQIVKYNWDHQNSTIRGFEVGRVHFQEEVGYREQSVAAIVLSGKRHPHCWDQKPEALDFFDLKGMIESLSNQLGLGPFTFKNQNLPFLHPNRQASFYAGKIELGSFGQAHPQVQRLLDVPQAIFFAEMDLHQLIRIKNESHQFQEIPIYPSSDRDWTITLAESHPSQDVIDAVNRVPSKLLEHVSLIDHFKSDKVGSGKKNVTFHFVYRNSQKTVSQDVVDKEHARIVHEVEMQLKQIENMNVNQKQ